VIPRCKPCGSRSMAAQGIRGVSRRAAGAFVQRRGRYVPASYVHPAKMLPELCRHIIQRYTKPRDWILDPFGGIGTTLTEGIHLNRNVLLIEVEKKFCRVARDNAKLAEKQGARGKWHIICADARQLAGLLGGTSTRHGAKSLGPYEKTSPSAPAAIVTSPPHVPLEHRCGKNDAICAQKGLIWQPYGSSKANLGALPYGCADTLLTSSASANTRKTGAVQSHPVSFATVAPAQAGSSMDAIVTSPPYEDGLGYKGGEGPQATSKNNSHYKGKRQRAPLGTTYSGQQAYFRGNTYLETMLQAYRNCYQVLKPGGYMVVVTKNFIRSKQIVPLSAHTVALCKSAGFQLFDWCIAVLAAVESEKVTPRTSFWRVLHTKRALKGYQRDRLRPGYTKRSVACKDCPQRNRCSRSSKACNANGGTGKQRYVIYMGRRGKPVKKTTAVKKVGVPPEPRTLPCFEDVLVFKKPRDVQT